MKVQIRSSVFETNSSSVHSISVCDKTDYDRWINNKVKFNPSELAPQLYSGDTFALGVDS